MGKKLGEVINFGVAPSMVEDTCKSSIQDKEAGG
jgi:hypothetical protein